MNEPIVDPLAALRADRQRARDAGDPLAGLCWLATGADGTASVRTLVLREVDGDFAIFTNASSPKWRQLQSGAQPELLVYLPSCRAQYRLRGVLTPIAAATMAQHWQQRPHWGRRLDHAYERQAQSSELATPDVLEAIRSGTEAPSAMPSGVRGLRLEPARIERLLLDDAQPPHDRRLWQRDGHLWREVLLMP